MIVIAEMPTLVSLVAMIIADPAATPVTRPVEDTDATAELLVVQVTKRSVTVVPTESFTVVESCTVAPATTEADVGVTVTEPTGIAVTFSVAVPAFASLVAVIATDPIATAVTNPVAETVATEVLLLV